MTHVMLDLETWGVRPGCAVRSVGAAAFELDGDGARSTFYRNVGDRSCWIAGLSIDRATAEWWQSQSPEARAVFAKDQADLRQVVDEFHQWYRGQSPTIIHPWCQGSGFDTSIWEDAARAVGQEVPWRFWNVRDTRTIYHLARLDDRTIPRAGTAHCALDDAVHQVRCVQAAYRMINGEK